MNFTDCNRSDSTVLLDLRVAMRSEEVDWLCQFLNPIILFCHCHAIEMKTVEMTSAKGSPLDGSY